MILKGLINFLSNIFMLSNPVPSERNFFRGGGGGEGLPIVYLLIRQTVIKETYHSLKIIGGGSSRIPHIYKMTSNL